MASHRVNLGWFGYWAAARVTETSDRVAERPLGYTGVEPYAIERRDLTETSDFAREGMKMPNFELPDQGLMPWDLYQTLEDGPLVLVFYRGDW